MEIDKGSSKRSLPKILLWMIPVLVVLLTLFAVARMTLPEPQNNHSELPQQLQESTAETGNKTNIPDPEETEPVAYEGPVIAVESVTIPKGSDEVTLNIQVFNNPGILGVILKISVDDQVFSLESGTQPGFPGLTLTSPGPSTASSPYTFMMDAMELSDADRCDGTMFAVTFKIKDPDIIGDFDVTLSCEKGDIFDENYIDLDVALQNGTITIQ